MILEKSLRIGHPQFPCTIFICWGLIAVIQFLAILGFYSGFLFLSLGLVAAAVPLSPIALTKPMTYLLEKFGWRIMLRILAIPLAFVAFLGFVFLQPKVLIPTQGTERNIRKRFEILFKRPEFIIWLVGIFIARLGGDIMTIHLVNT